MKRSLTFLLIICFLFSGCKKNKEESGVNESEWMAGRCFTQEGLVYQNPVTRKMEYFDYGTKSYRPLCGNANCLHNNEECLAVYLDRNADVKMLGRLGNKWYYHRITEDGRGIFCSCDLDGKNNKTIGEFSHTFFWRTLFFDNSCVVVTHDAIFDEETYECTGRVSGIYRYHFDTGEAELLCSEKEADDLSYDIYGRYNNQLIYQEKTGESYELRFMDLETKKITQPLENYDIFTGMVSDNFFVGNVREKDGYKVMELNLDTGEWKTVMENLEHAVDLFWDSDIKLMTYYDNSSGESHYETYQYSESGETVLVREGGEDSYLAPIAAAGDLLVCNYGSDWDEDRDFYLASISKEDFLAGKNNWTVLEY